MLNCLISMLKEILTFLNKAHEVARVITHTPTKYIRACVRVCVDKRDKGKEERREKGEKGGTGKGKEWRQRRRRREEEGLVTRWRRTKMELKG